MSDATDIRDIRLPPPQPLLDFLAQYWLWLLCGVLLLLLLPVALRLWRWRATRRKPASLLDATLTALEAARPQLAAGDVEGFCVRVSEVIRDYMERRFEVHALSLTTFEFLHACLADPVAGLADHREALERFLRLCDLAKFARWSPSGPEMEALLGSARTFVQNTARPAMAAASSKDAADGGRP